MQTNNMKTKIGLAISLFLFITTATAAVTKEPNIEDNTITENIRAKIMKEKPLARTKIHVKTRNGIVSITGFVAHDYQEDLVFKLAESTDGVKEVSGSLEPTRDELITARIEGVLIRNKLLVSEGREDNNLKLVTDKGVVSLYGNVSNQFTEDKITQLAKSIRGVVAVISHLKVLKKELLFCPLKQDIMVDKQQLIRRDI